MGTVAKSGALAASLLGGSIGTASYAYTAGGAPITAAMLGEASIISVSGTGLVTIDQSLASSGRVLAFMPAAAGSGAFTVVRHSNVPSENWVVEAGATVYANDAVGRTIYLGCAVDGQLRVLSAPIGGAEVYLQGVATGGDITAALQALVAANPGRRVMLPPGSFLLSGPVSSATGVLLSVYGAGSRTGQKTTITSSHAGYLFNPGGSYDIQSLQLVGPGTAGSCGIGNNTAGAGAGRAVLRDLYVSGFESCIDFGDEFEHPIGICYDDLYIQAFSSVGINIGGTGAAGSGESAWNFGTTIITNSSVTPAVTASSKAANTPSATFDRVTWSGTAPRFGWLIVRSADGTTNWEVVPNITGALTATTFDCLKVAGETWTYKVIQCIVGMSLNRGKVVNLPVLQAEYCGIGLLVQNSNALTIGSIYHEQRGASIARGTLASVYGVLSNISIGTAWTDQAAYVAVNKSGSITYDMLRCGSITVAVVGQYDSGSGAPIFGGQIIQSGSSAPETKAMLAGAGEYGGLLKRMVNGGAQMIADGTNQAGFSVNLRGVEKGAMRLNAAGQLEVIGDLPKFTVPSKSLYPALTNSAWKTTLTDAVATAVLVFDVPSNGTVAFQVPFMISVNSSGVSRQTATGVLCITAVSASGTVVAAASIAGLAKALQAGTLTDPAVTVTVASSTVTVLINTDTNLSPATLSFFAMEVAAFGNATTVTLQ